MGVKCENVEFHRSVIFFMVYLLVQKVLHEPSSSIQRVEMHMLYSLR